MTAATRENAEVRNSTRAAPDTLASNLIVLARYMQILSPDFVAQYPRA